MAKAVRGRLASEYARKAHKREPYDYVLLVCEGKKTEPNYLHGLRSAYRLSNANIRVLHMGATHPMALVQFAEEQLRLEPYDRAYCIFDRDAHATYEAALRRVKESSFGKIGRLHAVPSVPCFENLDFAAFCLQGFALRGGVCRNHGVEEIVSRLCQRAPKVF